MEREKSIMFFHKGKLFISQHGDTPKEIEFPKERKDTEEYEDIECIDNLTGTIEIMRRKVEK